MDFSTLQTEVFTQAGLDSGNATNVSNVKRWINIVQQDIAGRWPWPFLQSRESLGTIPDYTTGTAAVSSGGTAVTGTGTTWTATHGDGNYFIQFSGALDWYKVASRSSNTSITLATAYQGTAALTTATFILRKFFYSMSSSVDRILDIRNWNTPVKLIQTTYGVVDYMRPNPQGTNSVVAYVAFGLDSSGNVQLTPFGFPSDARLLEIRFLKRLTDLSASGDLSVIPVKWHHVITFGATAMAFMFLRRSEMAAQWATTYEKKIDDMKKEMRLSIDDTDVLKSMDQYTHSNWLRLPEQFPMVY